MSIIVSSDHRGLPTWFVHYTPDEAKKANMPGEGYYDLRKFPHPPGPFKNWADYKSKGGRK